MAKTNPEKSPSQPFPTLLKRLHLLWWPFRALPDQLVGEHLLMDPLRDLQIPRLLSVPQATATPLPLRGVPLLG